MLLYTSLLNSEDCNSLHQSGEDRPKSRNSGRDVPGEKGHLNSGEQGPINKGKRRPNGAQTSRLPRPGRESIGKMYGGRYEKGIAA